VEADATLLRQLLIIGRRQIESITHKQGFTAMPGKGNKGIKNKERIKRIKGNKGVRSIY
jgi:hypothetical protein